MKAVIFDIDGTLVDSVDLHAQAWKEAFARFNRDIEFDAIREQIGKGGDELMPTFLSKSEIDEFGEQLKEKRGEIFKENYLSKVKPFPRVRELMECVKKHGKKIAVGSSARKDELETYLKILNITDLVDVKTCADDTERSKPHPDIFEVALSKLNVEPAQAIVVGDSPYDAEAASKAHIKTIGFLSGGFEEKKLRHAGAIAIFEGPADLLEHFDASPIQAAIKH